jgi:hypothetical protein
METTQSLHIAEWKAYEKAVFRFLFIFFLLQAIPLDWKYYQQLININWTNLHYRDIFYISRYTPQFLSQAAAGKAGLATLTDWILIFGISLAGTAVWTFKDREVKNYTSLYYWLRVIVRYRLAIGIIGYGLIKFFPLQAPYPSISNLNTSYGEFSDWKIFSMSLGVVPGYESFLGGVELLAGLLLLFRKTATFGALIILVFTGNVFMSNLAYGGGEHLYAFYLILSALFILSFDALRIYNLVSLEKPTVPNLYKPVFSRNMAVFRLASKTFVFLFFIVLYGIKTHAGYGNDPYQYPKSKGLARAAGIYNVVLFKYNQHEHPYSLTDPVRWKDVVFEKWATISIRTNQRAAIDLADHEEMPVDDHDRDYESAGTSGRQYYSYTIDTLNKRLLLQNKNTHYPNDKLQLHYERPDSNTIVLAGIDAQRDSVYAVISKIDKKYPLSLGRRKTLKL